MKRRQIVEAAKDLVAHEGAFRVQEMGMELFMGSCPNDDPRFPYRLEIVTEAHVQAERVLKFLYQ